MKQGQALPLCVAYMYMVATYMYMYMYTFLNSACAAVIVYLKVTKIRVEDEYYMYICTVGTQFQETSVRPDISVMCA